MNKLSIVIPIYNEEGFIKKTIEAVIESNTNNYHKEIILVDDGSTDNSSKEILEAEEAFKKKPGISFNVILKKKNEGKGAALKDGFLATTGDIVLVQDADLEYNPEDYPLLLEPFIKNDADVVYGSRFISNRPHRVLFFWHYQVNRFLTSFSNMLTNLNLTDMETGYKTFRGDLIRSIAPRLVSKRFGTEPEITARISKIKGIKIFEVGISYYGRTYEEGKKIGWRDGIEALWVIIKFNILEK
ncbi:MAG: glycosyltransferase family 2 protein [Candidatus Daviesbacteria bacterium]|nr:glycosyltransferase family 2 protein [Candidatus Daviesbacteria bacterium]